MLKKALIEYKNNCEAEHKLSRRLLSMFRHQDDYPAKITAINKLILDIELTDVQYSERDIDMLGRGKLAKMLSEHKTELPTRFRFEKNRVLAFQAKLSISKMF